MQSFFRNQLTILLAVHEFTLDKVYIVHYNKVIKKERAARAAMVKKMIKYSTAAESLALAVQNKGIKAIETPKYSSLVRKTYVIRFTDPEAINGQVFYADSNNAIIISYPITFNCDVFNPPMLGEIIDVKISFDDLKTWRQKTFGE